VHSAFLNLSTACALSIAAAFPVYAAPLDRLVVGSPPPAALIEMLERTDEWPVARRTTNSILFADHIAFGWSDQHLQALFAGMRRLGITAEFEVGAIKEWAPDSAGTAAREIPMWRKLMRAGAPLTAISMDEPLLSARRKHASDEWAADQVAAFVITVRREFPHILIGDIEPYPSLSLFDHRHWMDLLQARLKQRGTTGLDFYRVDVDWTAFGAQHRGSWQEVKDLEADVRIRSMKFSLIYWASPYPARYGISQNDAAWYRWVMEQGRDYERIGGTPDQYVLENWVTRPSSVIPEDANHSVTQLIRDFSAEFIERPDHR
jgi:hypothetical protein